MEPVAAPPEPASPPPPSTVRRNPPRRARPPPTPLASAKPKPSSRSSFLQDEAAAASIPAPPPSSQEERLKVFLRIRPVPDRDRCKAVARPMPGKDLRRKPKQAAGGDLCLVPTGPNSVALTVPQSKLVDPKRGRTEVFDGFSAVFSPDSTQLDIFVQVMNPLVDDFLGGKSGLLVAMGPTGSGKTHTIFGSPRNPGILPLALRQIFKAQDENKVASPPARSFSLSMFEILSEGKGERILDLLSDAAECVLQQSSIKGLQEVPLSNLADAESLASRGMLKRSTAATNANSNSSRSQCIITIHGVHKSSDADSEHLLSNAVLTIADLAGAERERKTGNQGSRLLESNFINNTSMVFGLCLRSLLEHQKNQKKPLEKHFKNSMLTRYLRDYLEGRKKMTLILNVKPANDDYLDTSFLLRQASPYMKIKYTSLDDSSDLISQKRSNASLICQENKKKRKVQKPEVLGLVAEEVLKELKSHGAENFSAPCSLNGESVSCDTSSISFIDEQEQSFRGLKAEKSCCADAFGPMSHTEEGNTKVELHAIHKKLDASECFTGQTSAHAGGVTPSSSHSDNQSNQSLTEHHMLPCLKTERVSLSPQFTSCSKKATIEQSEDEIEELSKIILEDIHHDVNIREVKHPDYLSSSQQVSSDTEDVGSSQSSLELPGMVASQKKLEELDLEPERCEPGVVNATVECAVGHSQAPEQMSDCEGRVPCLLKEITCPAKASKAPSKVSEAEEAADKKKEGFTSSPEDTKKTRRRLQPAAAMLLKEFPGADFDVDTRREERGKSSSSVAAGRSDALIRVLKARPVRRV
ncbi:kinesin-like protein KIN-6 isoform X4 [Panicum virgatum]|uniref:kinesin-like protein KIN-6 isoform X4 n=1 Tax=Panicum virgatum TaxID=38727 RepID=UPI0019D5A73D|nr:kinesin-like protein KIN-6 isoform X4 [Panicum virgatum]